MLRIFLSYAAVILIICISGFSFLGENDDWVLWYFLKNGVTDTLILSKPLSILISKLYKIFPTVQWYSVLIVSYLIIISLLISYYVSKIKDKRIKFISFLLGLLVIVHFLMNITVTELTLLFIIFSLPMIKINHSLFWILFLLASLLRVEMIAGLIPLFLPAYLIFFNKKNISVKQALFIGGILSLIGYNFAVSSVFVNQDYKEWLKFVKARAYFMDLHGEDNKNILSADEKFVNKTWWAQDDILLPTEKVIKAANFSSLNIVINSYKNLNLSHLITILIRYKLLIFLFLITLWLIYKEKNKYNKILYILLTAAMTTLIIARDMERVAYPITVMWAFLIFLKFYEMDKKEFLTKFLYLSFIILFAESSLNRLYRHSTKEELKKEAVTLMAKHPLYYYELSLGFPRSFGLLSMIIIQNHLFDEKNWLSLEKNKILLSGWISRHPFFYKSHDISFKNEKRKYKNYYEYLIDDHTAFIGTKEINGNLNRKMLSLYDKKYDGYHTIKVLDESKHFTLTQVIKIE